MFLKKLLTKAAVILFKKNSTIVKYYYNLKQLFSIVLYFKM